MRTNGRWRWAWAMLALLLAASPALLSRGAWGDVIHLVNGGRIDGRIVDEDEETFTVRTKIGLQVVHKDDIDRVDRVLDPKAAYKARAARLRKAHHGADAWVDLGLWAEEHGLPEAARRAFEQAIHRSPDHQAARKKLGFRLIDGEWISPDELKRREGLVRHKGQWVTPEQKEKLEQGYVEVDGNWVSVDALEREKRARAALAEERKRHAAELKRRRAAAAAAGRAAPTPAAPGRPSGRPRVVPIPPPAAGKPPTDAQLAAWLQAQKARARETERVLGLTFEDVEEGPLLVHTTQPKTSERFRTFLRQLGKLYKAETRIFNLPFEAKIWPGKLQIYFFKEKSQFDAFATRVDKSPGAVQSGGYFMEGEDTAGGSRFHIAMYDLSVGTLAHELSHAFTARYDYSRKHIIPWVNEGVAEFLRIYVAEHESLGTKDRAHLPVARGLVIRNDPRATLGYLMQKQQIAGTEGWAYSLSWSLVDFMVYADTKAFVQFLKILKRTDGTFQDRWKNATVAQQRAAIEEAYGVDVDRFEQRWREYVQKGR